MHTDQCNIFPILQDMENLWLTTLALTFPKKFFCEYVIPCKRISDHDAPFVVWNIKKQKLDVNLYVMKIIQSSQLPLSSVYSFEDLDDQVETLNKLVTDCLSCHAPIKRLKFSHPPAQWMKTLDIINLQKERNELHTTAHRTQT